MKKEIRLYLVEARNKKGFSMRRAAQEAGMTYQHYSKIENGDRGTHVSFMVMTRIAEALAIPLNVMREKEKEYRDLYEDDNDWTETRNW